MPVCTRGTVLEHGKKRLAKRHLSVMCLAAPAVLALSSALFADATLLKAERGGALVELEFEAGDYALTGVVVNGERCTAIELKGVTAPAVTLTKGFPELPYFTQSVAIPGDAAMGIEIVSQTVKELRVDKIVPSKGAMPRSIDPATVPYTFGDIYSKDEWYPGRTVALGEPYIINTVRGQVVTFCPFRYNAKQGILRVTTSIVVRVKRTGTSSQNALLTRDRTITPAFDGLYSRRFINFEAMRPLYTFLPDGDKMIVITPAALKSAVQPLVDWKNQKGIATAIYEYPSQTGGSGVSALKSFIQSKYDGEKISYILLVGDIADIDGITYTCTTEDDLIHSDAGYTLLSGTDVYPDAFIGRFCSSKASEITAMVNKTVNFEKSPKADAAWYAKAMCIGSDRDGDSPLKDKEWMEVFRTKSLAPYGYTTVDTIYDGDNDDPLAPKEPVIDGINDGRSLVLYMGHGWVEKFVTSGFHVSDVPKLTNAGMPPVVVAVACNCGWFGCGSPCLAEAMMNPADKGALVFLGSYISMYWTPPQHTMSEMVEGLLIKDKCLSVGGMFYNGECGMLDKGQEPGGEDTYAKETFYMWIYFGDPSVMHFTKPPKTLAVTAPETIGTGNQQVKLTFADGITGRVALYDSVNKRLLGSAMMTAKATSAAVNATIPDNSSSVILTVTAFNRVPVIRRLKVGAIGTSPGDPMGEVPFSITLRHGKSAVFFTVRGPSAMRSELTIFDLRGNRIHRESGERIGSWRYTNDRGERVARGTYFASVKLFDRDRVARSGIFVLGVE